MPKLVFILLAAASILVPDVGHALVMCGSKRPDGSLREGAPIRPRTACRANELQLDPVALGLQGPAGEDGAKGDTGDQGSTGPQGPPGPVPEKVRVHLIDPVSVNSGPYVCGYEEIVMQFAGEAEDTHAMHDPLGDPTRVSIVEAGTYLVTVNFRVYSSPEAGSAIIIRKNGSTDLASNSGVPRAASANLSLSTTAVLEAGDYLQIVYPKPVMCGNIVVLQDFTGTQVTVTRLTDN